MVILQQTRFGSRWNGGSRKRRSVATWSVLFGALLLCPPGSGASASGGLDYHLDVGDVIEVSVASVPELQRRAAIQFDGTVSLPLLGSVPIAGLSPHDAQSKIQTGLASKVFRQRTPDGRQNAIMIDSGEVTVTVAVYRPVYVSGDVSHPGEQTYQPLMSVRQAIAIAGGYDITHSQPASALINSVDLLGENETLWIAFAREQARIWRIRRELSGEDTNDDAVMKDVPLSPPTVAAIMGTERDYLQLRLADYEREKAFLERGVNETDRAMHSLEEQKKKELAGLELDADELAKVKKLVGKGLAPSPRVSDARHAILVASSRLLEVDLQMLQIGRQQADLARQRDRLDNQRRMALVSELQDANVRVEETRARLRTVGVKLAYSSAAVGVLKASGQASTAKVRIIRKGSDGRQELAADENTELWPGDIVEVTLGDLDPQLVAN